VPQLPDFIPGRVLCQHFFSEAVAPILEPLPEFALRRCQARHRFGKFSASIRPNPETTTGPTGHAVTKAPVFRDDLGELERITDPEMRRLPRAVGSTSQWVDSTDAQWTHWYGPLWRIYGDVADLERKWGAQHP